MIEATAAVSVSSVKRPRLGLITALLCLSLTAASGGRAVLAVEARFTTSDKAEIRYLDVGPRGTAPTLLLVPGWRFTAEIWQQTIDAFAKERRVLAIDPRSQGASSKMLTGNTPERRAADVHELVQSLGLANVVLVGWSQGVQDVAAYLGQFGTDALAGVVLVDSSVAAGPAEIELHPEFAKSVLGGIAVYAAHPAEYSVGLLRAVITRPLPESEIDRLAKLSLATPTDIGSGMLVLDMFAVDRRPHLARCDKPALVVASAESPMLEAQRQTAAALKARFEAIAGAGHAVFVDQPERFNAVLAEFLAGLARPK